MILRGHDVLVAGDAGVALLSALLEQQVGWNVPIGIQ